MKIHFYFCSNVNQKARVLDNINGTFEDLGIFLYPECDSKQSQNLIAYSFGLSLPTEKKTIRKTSSFLLELLQTQADREINRCTQKHNLMVEVINRVIQWMMSTEDLREGSMVLDDLKVERKRGNQNHSILYKV